MSQPSDSYDDPVWRMVMVGEQQRRAANTADAIATFTRAITESSEKTPIPVRVETYICRGVAFAQGGEHSSAIDDFTTAISLDSNSALAYYNRGFAHEQTNAFDNAISDYDQAISLRPTDAGFFLRRGMVFKRLKRSVDSRNDFAMVRELRDAQQNDTANSNRRLD